MFAFKSGTEVSTRILLTVVILLNALAPTAAVSSLSPARNQQVSDSPSGNSGFPASESPTIPQQINFNRLPLNFIANVGQFDKNVQFQTSTLGGSISFTPSEVVLALMDKKFKLKYEENDPFSSAVDNSKVVRIEYKNAEQDPIVEGMNLLPGVANFMVGSDKKAWVTNAPMYDGIIYRNLYAGIDLKFEGASESLKGTFLVASGADPALIQWRYKGAGAISLDGQGNLLITLPATEAGQTDTTLIEHTPIAWQEVNGQHAEVPVQYAVDNNDEISFLLPQGYDASLPLIIDPTLTYSTYLGSTGTDVGNAITTDADGNAYITGYSYCGNFPILNPIQQGKTSGRDVIISKISADGSTLLYSTCVGGAGDDYGTGIALDSQGRIVVGGMTNSTGFPIVSGIATYGGNSGCTTSMPCQDNFVLALNAQGSAIHYSSYLGGDGRDELGSIAIDGSDNILLVGSTTSSNFPTVQAYDNTYSTGGICSDAPPCYDVTVTKIDPDLSGTSAILYSTYLGGIHRDRAFGFTHESSGKVYLIGSSTSDDFPIRNALQVARQGSDDVIIVQIDPSLSGDASLLYSTYFGTSSTDVGYSIARDASGNLYLTGSTKSDAFPLQDPLQSISHISQASSLPGSEVFVTKLDISTNTLVYSTYLGGSENDDAYGINIDSYNRAYVVGTTRSSDFPTYNAIQSTKGADGCVSPPCADAFLSVLEPNGQAFAYSTYLGGDYDDVAFGVTVDQANNVYVVGQTYSANFPTTPGAYDVINTTTNKLDAFITKVGALGAPTAPTFTPSPTSTSTATNTPTETSTPTDTATATFTATDPPTPTRTSTKAPPVGLSCLDWREGLSHGWLQSPWMSTDAQIQWDTNGMYGSATNTGAYQAGAYIPMPVGGPYRVVFSGQRLTNISVAQSANAPSTSGPLIDTLTTGPDGSYSVSGSYLEVRWNIDAPINLSTTPIFEGFCYATYTPTSTATPSATPTSTQTATLTPTATISPTSTPPSVIIPKGDVGYKYKIYSLGGVPGNFGALSFDDTTFSNGDAPFGSGGTYCPIQSTVKTSWPTSSEIVLRKYFNLPSGASNLHVTVSVDNDIQIFVNEVEITGGLVSHDNCPNVNEFVFSIPNSALSVGQNLLAVRARDRGFESFVDVQIVGDLPLVTPTETSTPTSTPPSFVASTFDTGDEAWTVVNDAYAPVYSAQGGNPGGYISATDMEQSQYWYWRAPAKFYGNFSTVYGKMLTFDLKQNNTTNQANREDVILVGGGIRLVYDTSYNPDTTWTSYSIYLHESAGWRINTLTGSLATQSQMQTVLSALSDLQIRGEYRSGADIGSLDNVVLGNTGPTPTPTATFTAGPSPTPTNTPTFTPTATPTLPSFQEMEIPGWIGSPAQLATVSGIVPITLASGISLQSGTIDYWPVNDVSQVQVLGTVSNQNGGDTLATLDTTTLSNGSYVIRLQGTNSAGLQQDSGVMITVAGEYKPGRVRFTITDITIPVVGLPITIARTYDSLETNQVGDFGNGWSLAIGNPKLEANLAHDVTLTMPDGRRSTFYFTPQHYSGPFSYFMYPHYTPEAGVYGSLTSNGCDLLALSGGQYFCFLDFGAGGDYQPTEYTYTDPYGRKFLMDADGTLRTITDLNNNVLTFSPTGITSSAGNINVPFVRDAQGRITKITYPAGKDYLYSYLDHAGMDTGDLRKVTFPNVTQLVQQSIILQYDYYADHFFKQATDPRGNQPVITTYDTSNRIQSVTDAAGNKTTYDYDLTLRKTTIQYLGDPAITTDDLGDAVLIYDAAGYLTNYTDPLDNPTIYTYDSNHNLIKVRDPLIHDVQYTYNTDGHPASIIDPLMKTLGTVNYNQYGGPTTLTTAQGGSATVAYDPVTFMPLSASDSLGSLGSYTWLPEDKGNPTTFTNQYGETTGYTYTPQGYVDTVTDPLGHKTHYAYDEFGRVTDMITAFTPPNNVPALLESSTTHYKHDELGRMIESTVAYGTSRAATTKYEYDANGNRTLVTDPLNRQTKYQYDNANRLILITYAAHAILSEQSQTKYVYDIYGRLTDTIIAFGTADESITHYEYYNNGLKKNVITAFTKPYASTTHYEYYADGRVKDVIIAYTTVDEATTHYVYDAAGRTTDVTIAVGTADASTTHYTYYDSGLTKSVTTAYGNALLAATTNYFYDPRGRSTVTQYADGTSSSQHYDLAPSIAGWVNSTTDQGGVTTKDVYDAAGRLDQLITSAYDPQTQQTLQQVRSYDYDAADRMTDSFDALNNRTSFTYYPTGQMATSKAWKDAATGFTTTYEYYASGEQMWVLDANSHQTQYQYNERGMLKTTILPGNVTTSQTYDFAGRLATSTDENSIVTKSVYNAASQLTSVTMAFGTPDATTINYAYNLAGQLASMTDAKSHVTSFLYNDAGQQTKKTLPDLTYEQYFYNAAGNMISQRLADGNSNNFTYDSLNRLTQIAYFDNQFANFTYLANGQRDTASTRTAFPATPQVTDYDYDPFGRLKQVMVPDGRVVSYTYNNNDQRTSMTTPAGTVNYGYNGLSQLATVTMGSATTAFEYDPVGFMTKKTLPNGDKMVYAPNVRDQLTNITSSTSTNTVLQSFAYDLDNAGNRKQVTELGGAYIKWTYDDLYRLKSEIRYNSSNAITWQAAFTYDPAGNRATQTVNGTTTNYTYNALDQLTNTGSVTYGYNGRGDMTSITNGANVTTYAYNAADQLTSVTAGGTTSSYVYNADGKRVKQTVGSAVTNSLWDEASPYGDVVYEYNNSGVAQASYVLGGTGLISQTRGSTTNYFLQDGQGSTRALTHSTTGAITDTYSYTAFGESFAMTGTTVNPYRYTGQQFDTSTGLYSLRARYYNPALGRFLSGDTYPVNFSNPIELNRYVYAANRPINLTDPTGKAALAEYSILLGEGIGAAGGGLQAYLCGGSVGNIIESAALGVLLGFDFAAAALEVPLVAASFGLGLSGAGGISTYRDHLIHGWNKCNGVGFAMSMLGVASSSLGLAGQGLRTLEEARLTNLAQSENLAAGMRSRPWGAEIWERLGLMKPKPQGLHLEDILWKGPFGLRWVKPWWAIRWYTSDLDPGFFFQNGKLVPEIDPVTMKPFWRLYNDAYGTDFQHGTHIDGMLDPRIIEATRARAQSPDSTIYLPNGQKWTNISLIDALILLDAPPELIDFLLNHK